MSNPKVFEFAKEVGLTPLALMDKIREWSLPVKSHMAELDPEVLATIKLKLTESTSSASGAKKSASRKKPAASGKSGAGTAAAVGGSTGSAKKSAASTKGSAKAAPKATSKVASAKTSTVKSEEESESTSLPVKSGATVVRRKKVEAPRGSAALDAASDPAADPVVGNEASEVENFAKSPDLEAADIKLAEIHTEPEASKARASSIGASPVEEVSPVLAKTSVSDLSKGSEVARGATVGGESSTTTGPSHGSALAADVSQGGSPSPHTAAISTAAATSAAVTSAAAVAAENEKKFAARKKEVAIGQSGVTSSQSAAAASVKRNIIGRMDLSRVTPPQGSQGYRGGGGGSYGGGGGGGRPQMGSGTNTGTGGFPNQRNKGTLRAGFIKAAPLIPEIPIVGGEEFDRKKDDKRRTKVGAAPSDGASRVGAEEQPQVFDAAEFRKREMVFQPKKKKSSLGRTNKNTEITKPAAHKRIVKVFGSMKMSELAGELGVKVGELTKILMKSGAVATPNTDLDFDTIALVVPELGFEAQNIKRTAEEVLKDVGFGQADAELMTKPPVVTVMGHVDHGKTSLLDAIRSTDVASGEAGGITQHIGAYQVKLPDGRFVTFLDTPGHEAFTAMRARGANVTDVAVIVVAADDGVMPQTVEAISHAKAAKVPLIIAVNKIDKPGANPDRIKQQLTEYQVVPEEWGGDAIFVHVSALKKTGIQELLDQVLLVAEVQELKANPQRSATGAVIESRLEKGRGSVATLLVQDGTLEVGQSIVAGSVTGRVRSLMNYKGERMEKAGPGTPVEVLGLNGVPQAGDRFDIVISDVKAEEVAQIRRDQTASENQRGSKISLEAIMAKINKGDVKELQIVLKSDVAGSLEAIQGMFSKMNTAEVKIRILHAAIGGISESDVLLAGTSGAIIVGFNVRPDGGAQAAAKAKGVEIRCYSIVYELVDDMKKAMAGLLQPDIVEKVMGRAEVRSLFQIPKMGTIAGSFVLDGKVQRNNMVRLVRDGKIIYTGVMTSLKRFKDDAKEVATGFECGIGIENYNDIKVGDIIEAFVKEEVARELGAPMQQQAGV